MILCWFVYLQIFHYKSYIYEYGAQLGNENRLDNNSNGTAYKESSDDTHNADSMMEVSNECLNFKAENHFETQAIVYEVAETYE